MISFGMWWLTCSEIHQSEQHIKEKSVLIEKKPLWHSVSLPRLPAPSLQKWIPSIVSLRCWRIHPTPPDVSTRFMKAIFDVCFKKEFLYESVMFLWWANSLSLQGEISSLLYILALTYLLQWQLLSGKCLFLIKTKVAHVCGWFRIACCICLIHASQESSKLEDDIILQSTKCHTQVNPGESLFNFW